MKKTAQDITMSILKDTSRTVDIKKFLIDEVVFYRDMEGKFGHKEKLVQDTEKRLRDLMWIFAKSANEAFPEEKQIGRGSLGLLNEPLTNYNFTLVIEKK